MSKLAMRDVYGEVLIELGKIYPNLVVVDADVSKSTKTIGFAKTFPDRFFDVGIAEANLMGISAGIASTGKIVFTSTFSVFASGRAYDQVRQSIAYPGRNVKIVSTHCGLTAGEDGAMHQSFEDMALMRSIPNMRVIAPCDGVEVKSVLKNIAEIPGPFYVRLARPATPVIFEESYEFKLGRGTVIKEGKEGVIIACGLMTAIALEASDLLSKEGINIGVVSMSSIKPVDTELIKNLSEQYKFIFSCEDHSIIGGLGGAIAEVLPPTNAKLVRLGMEDEFGDTGKFEELLRFYRLDAESIAEKIKSAVKK
ncbi:MAG TPA: transketolase family protein [bacterium]|nr:transketolase family protein [Dictyoglomota bacterium]HOK29927.1 transketolase family protein [bacterium]HOP55511.1 transketolase family protein [bacterium]HRU33099.1 transketolase family protein [bacterium]